jgi:CRP-like cAMP-binding protein
MTDIAGVLAGIELFAGWRPEELASLAGLGRLERWRRGARVVEEGDQGPRLMVLLDGRVEILRRDERGLEHPIAAFGPGESLGEMSLLLDLPRTATVRALTDLEVFAMDRAAFRRGLDQREPVVLQLGHALSRSLARRLHALNERTLALVSENAELRRSFSDDRRRLFQLLDYE